MPYDGSNPRDDVGTYPTKRSRHPATVAKNACMGLFKWIGNAANRVVAPIQPLGAPIGELDEMRRLRRGKEFLNKHVNIRDAQNAGAEEAAMHIPSAESQSLTDSPYLAAQLTAAHGYVDEIRDQNVRKGNEIRNRIGRPLIDLNGEVTGIATDAIDVKIAEAVSAWRQRLVDAYVNAVHEKTKYRRFLSDNRIVHETPPDPRYVRATCLFLLAVAIESYFNAVVLEDQSADGLAGSTKLAVAIALGNILYGLAVGFVFGRLTLHCRRGIKAIGWVGCLSFGTLAIVLNCGVAVARHEIIVNHVDMDVAFTQAGATLRNHWDILFDDLKSFFLMMTGAACWLLAFAEAFHIIAPYPGWWRRYVRVRDAEELSEGLFEEFTDELNSIALKAKYRMITRAAVAWDDEHARRNDFQLLERCLQLGHAEISMVSEGMRRIKDAYVARNHRVRADVPPPPWFSKMMLLNWGLPPRGAADLEPCLRLAHDRAIAIDKRVMQAQQDILQASLNAVVDVRNARLAALGVPHDPNRGSPENFPAPTDSQLRRS